MRILFLCEGDAETADSWSGVSLSVVSHLRALGHRVIPGDVDLYGAGRLVVALRTASLGRRRWWVRYHLSGAAFRARSRRAEELVRRHWRDVDVILQIGATFRIGDTRGLPLVLYCDSNVALSAQAAYSGYSEAAFLTGEEIAQAREREAQVYRDAALVFTMSDLVRASFIDDFGLRPERLVTIRCAPNTPLPDLAAGYTRLGLPPRVLFVGRDFARKGGDLLLRAFAAVRERVPDARLLMVGSALAGPKPEWLDVLGFQSRDTAAGRETMDRAYRESTVFCLPTRFEPFGTSFVEAMSYGLPCIGPRAWAVPEIIAHGETGLLVEPERPDRLADALADLLSDRALAERMGRAGRLRALERFTWPRIAARMTEVMAPLVASAASDDAAWSPAP